MPFSVGERVVCIIHESAWDRPYGELVPVKGRRYVVRDVPDSGQAIRLVEIVNRACPYTDGLAEARFDATAFRPLDERRSSAAEPAEKGETAMPSLWTERDAKDGITLGDNRGHYERMLGMRTDVSVDGDATIFSVQTTNRQPVKVLIPIEEIAMILHEVRHASNLMIDRQRLKLDRGQEKLMDFCACALRPRYQDVLIDPFTGDRIFVLQFDNHAPLAIRMSVGDIKLCYLTMQTALAKSMH